MWYFTTITERSVAPTTPMFPTAKLSTFVARYTSTIPMASRPITRPDTAPFTSSWELNHVVASTMSASASLGSEEHRPGKVVSVEEVVT